MDIALVHVKNRLGVKIAVERAMDLVCVENMKVLRNNWYKEEFQR